MPQFHAQTDRAVNSVFGRPVATAQNANAALEVLESHENIVLFSDIQMAGALNGIDLSRQVLARWPHAFLGVTYVR
jgi:two-component SAPR family response regulator